MKTSSTIVKEDCGKLPIDADRRRESDDKYGVGVEGQAERWRGSAMGWTRLGVCITGEPSEAFEECSGECSPWCNRGVEEPSR